MPLISVIVPVYKVEPYIRRCIDSILSQTFTDFELILVDDGSPDHCPAICDEYALVDRRVHVIHPDNSGLSAARNAGIDWAFNNSDSKWLSFVDSDDWILPNFLECLYKVAIECNSRISACSLYYSNGEDPLQSKTYKIQTKTWDEFYLENWTLGVVAVNKLYDKELFRELRYPAGKIHEDEYLTYKLLAKAGTVSYVDGELYIYFQNPGGITKNGFSLAKMDAIQALEEQREFAKKNGYQEFYISKTDALQGKLAMLLSGCQITNDLSAHEKKEVIKYLRSKLRKLLFKEWKIAKNSQELNWRLENAYPKLMWCYWTCVGIVRKIKQTVKRDARN